MSSSDNFTKRPQKTWNQIFTEYRIDGPKIEDYKISSSLKDLWNDDADKQSNFTSKQIAEIPFKLNLNVHNNRLEMLGGTQHGNDAMASANGVNRFAQPARENAMAGNINAINRGRPITARNGVQYQVNWSAFCCIKEKPNNPFSEEKCLTFWTLQPKHNPSTIATDALKEQQHRQKQSLEVFLQQVQLIVKFGFLDCKILNEPISPETIDLVQMLCFYVKVSRCAFFSLLLACKWTTIFFIRFRSTPKWEIGQIMTTMTL